MSPDRVRRVRERAGRPVGAVLHCHAHRPVILVIVQSGGVRYGSEQLAGILVGHSLRTRVFAAIAAGGQYGAQGSDKVLPGIGGPFEVGGCMVEFPGDLPVVYGLT